MKEAELAQKFVDYLDGLDLYFEVDGVDIVAKNGPHLTAIEIKTQFNFKVIEQAHRNKIRYHYSYVAVPAPKRYSFAATICREMGIGVLYYYHYGHIEERERPKLNRSANHYRGVYAIKLTDEMKNRIPGTPEGKNNAHTAFKNTVWELEKYVKRHPGCSIKEAIEKIDHHYASFSGAKSSIYKWIRQGVIKTISLKDKGLYYNDPKKKEDLLRQG